MNPLLSSVGDICASMLSACPEEQVIPRRTTLKSSILPFYFLILSLRKFYSDIYIITFSSPSSSNSKAHIPVCCYCYRGSHQTKIQLYRLLLSSFDFLFSWVSFVSDLSECPHPLINAAHMDTHNSVLIIFLFICLNPRSSNLLYDLYHFLSKIIKVIVFICCISQLSSMFYCQSFYTPSSYFVSFL